MLYLWMPEGDAAWRWRVNASDNWHMAANWEALLQATASEDQKEAMCFSLSQSDSEDPRKKYCFSVRRNPLKGNGELGKRSPFNDNKTRLYRPSLYERLGSDTNLSFRYSMNPDDEETDEGIIAKWTKNIIE